MLRDRVDRTVEREVGVDLVGEQRDVVIVGDLRRSSRRTLRRIDGAGRIVRIDDDQRAGRGSDQPLESARTSGSHCCSGLVR